MANWLIGKSELLRVVQSSLSLLFKRNQQKIKLVALIQIFFSLFQGLTQKTQAVPLAEYWKG
jgi:hypothetical protein